MTALNDLMLDFDSENDTSVLTNDVFWYSGDRKKSTSPTMIFYTVHSSLTDSAKLMVSKIHSYKNLEVNWDSYGAIPPSSANIERAISFVKRADKNLLPFYFSAPGPNGELVLEFRQGDKEAAAYFNPDGTTELILNEGDNIILEGTVEGNYKDLLGFINV